MRQILCVLLVLGVLKCQAATETKTDQALERDVEEELPRNVEVDVAVEEEECATPLPQPEPEKPRKPVTPPPPPVDLGFRDQPVPKQQPRQQPKPVPPPPPRPAPAKKQRDAFADMFDDWDDAVPLGRPQPPPPPPQPTVPAEKPPLPWSEGEPSLTDEVFMWTDEHLGTRSWVLAIAYREWQRWSAFAQYEPLDEDGGIDVLVHVNLELFPRSVWVQVLRLCAKFGHSCQLDSVAGQFQVLKQRCEYCLGNRTEPCVGDPRRCLASYCDKCVAERTRLRDVLADPNRRVTARVVKRPTGK
jgi:hypothetical protein